MKKLSLVLALSFLTASAAFAADLSLEQNTADLGACDGVAKLVKTAEGKAEIRIKNVRRCSNLSLQMKLERSKESGEYSISLPMNLDQDAVLQLSSNSGSTSSRLSVSTAEPETAPEVFTGDSYQLRNCFGSVRFFSGHSGPASLMFQGVKNCNRLKVVSVNGRPFSYEKSLQDQGQFWGGSFTLPASALQYGHNRVKVSVEGPMNADQFMLVFDSYQRD
jgi:hypothetical protein